MIKPFRKRVIGALIIAVFLVFMVVLKSVTGFYAEGFFNAIFDSQDGLSVMGDSEYKIAGIEDASERLAEDLLSAQWNYYVQLQTKADITAKALYRNVYESKEPAIVAVGDGFVIKIEEGTVEIPDDAPTDVQKLALQFEDTKGHVDYPVSTGDGERIDILVYSQIRGPYYYVEIANGWDFSEYVNMRVNYTGDLEGIEQAYKVSLYLFANDWKNSKYFHFLRDDIVYIGDPMLFTQMSGASGSSLSTGDNSVPFPENIQTLVAMTPEQRWSLDGRFMSAEDGKSVRFMVRNLDAIDCTAIMAFEENDVMTGLIERTEIELFMMVILSVVFLIWITSVYKEVFNGTVTKKKREKYTPSKVRLITVSYGILTAIFVLAAGFYNQALGSIYQENISLEHNLNALDQRMKSLRQEREYEIERRRGLYIEIAQRVASLLEEYPENNHQFELKEINKVIGSEFIMLFDANGREVSTSSNYINLELGAENAGNPSRTADFRRILKGVTFITHDKEMVEEIGRELALFGVRTNDKVNGGYGALLLAVDQDEMEEAVWNYEVGTTLETLCPEGRVLFSVDPEGNIIASSRSGLLYDDFDEITNKNMDTIRREGLNDFIMLRGIRYYGITKTLEEDDHIYFACTPNNILFANSMKMSMIGVVGYLIMFLVLAAYLLHGYTDAAVERMLQKQEETPVNVPYKSTAYDRYKAMILNKLGCTTPEKKARYVMILGFVGAILSMVQTALLKNDYGTNHYVFSYIMSGQWDRGINLFALTAVILLFASLFIVMLAVRFILDRVAVMLSSRGQTICRLLSNMFNYMGILVFIYWALSYLGVDTNAILTSVGVMGIGLSMGARDMIADILAGVSTIFEGEYQVGDIVDIGGYRGMVDQIGVRSTRVIGRGGNVKIISNKDIKDVINLTKKNSWVAITIRVDVAYSLTDVEGILQQTLPRLGQECKQIISGPYYKGVLSVEGGFAVLSIIAECKEENYHKVLRILNREVLLALRNNNVPVR